MSQFVKHKMYLLITKFSSVIQSKYDFPGPSLGRDLYALPGIAEALIGSIFASLENVPDFRLRTIVRVFFKPFVYSCAPVFHETVLLPIFAHIAPFSEFVV